MENYIRIDKHQITKRYKQIDKYAHKGTQGHGVIIGGSYGKIGSVVLSSKACLKTGAGLVTAYIPKCGYEIVQTANPEVMVLTGKSKNKIKKIKLNFEPEAIGIGMGLGLSKATQFAFYDFLKNNKSKLVVDADALNILSKNTDWFSLLPPKMILTPHLKELERIIGIWNSEEEKLERVKALSIQYDLVIVVKGAPTLIVYRETVYENITGNQALATAGSGDVLTGMITSLIAQNYEPIDAAIIGVYLHGLTADISYPNMGYQSFIASDIINTLGEAYLHIIT
jgi:ADP-dependent NAD(P)H-hydrate dehydratase